MTLLEFFTAALKLGITDFALTKHQVEKIRRALAIAQAVDEASRFPKETVTDAVGSAMVQAIKERADKLLAERKP